MEEGANPDGENKMEQYFFTVSSFNSKYLPTFFFFVVVLIIVIIQEILIEVVFFFFEDLSVALSESMCVSTSTNRLIRLSRAAGR